MKVTTQSIPAAFHETASSFSDRVAIAGRERTWTYRDLSMAIRGMAGRLDRALAPDESSVVLLADHGDLAVLGGLAILSAGRAYVPADPQQPGERVRRLLENAQARTVLVDERNSQRFRTILSDMGERTIELVASPADGREPEGELAARSVDPMALAYILYTSGSTGTPKGVMQQHHNVVHHARAYGASIGLRCEDRHAFLSRHSFDAGIMDIYGTLLSGAALYPWDLLQAGWRGFGAWLRTHDISILHCTSSLLRLLAGSLERQPYGVRAVVLGGDEVRPRDVALVAALFGPGCKLHCGYGPSESTTALQLVIEQPGDWAGEAVPLGSPIGGTEVFLCDDQGRPTSAATGEMAIRSRHLALGYWRDDKATQEAFLPDPQGGDLRTYLSGDLGRLTSDGQLVFVRRKEHLAKVRGYSVATGEVEAELSRFPGVEEVAVSVREAPDGEKRLVAYVVGRSGENVEAAALRAWLRKSLPEYMVPSKFVSLRALPLTANGKLDRQVLPAPDWTESAEAADSLPSELDLVEELLAALWIDLLQVEGASRTSDFFSLGGHSLTATQLVYRLRGAFGVEVSLREVFDHPTLLEQVQLVQAKRRERGGEASRAGIARRDPGQRIPLSLGQQGIWFLCRLNPDDPSFNIPIVLRLSGKFDSRVFERALDEVVARHEILRTYFPMDGAEPAQVVAPELRVACVIDSVERWPEDERETRCLEAIAAEMARPFDVTRLPLLECRIWRLALEEQVLMLKMHHLIADGWSIGVLARELSEAYGRIAAGGDPGPRPAPALQYADYAVWQERELGQTLDEQVEYWKEHLSTLQASELFAQKQPNNGASTVRTRELERQLVAHVEAFSRKEGVTPYMTLLGGFAILLSRWTGRERVVIGCPVTSRPDRGLEGLVGLFVNTLPVSLDLGGNPSFRDLICQVREATLGAYDHRDVPLHHILRALRLRRDQPGTPALQALFTLQSFPAPTLELEGVRVRVLDLPHQTAKSDWSLTIWRHQTATFLTLLVDGLPFPEEQAESAIEHYLWILERGIRDAELPVSEIGEVPVPQLDRLRKAWSGSSTPYPERPFDEQIAEAVAVHPQRPAVVDNGQITTYEELGRRSSALASELAGAGVAVGTFVPVILPSSVNLVGAFHAIAMTGAAFVPLATSWPTPRLQRALRQLAAPVAVAGAEFAELLAQEGMKRIEPGDVRGQTAPFTPAARSLDQPAYAMYTSGSTGEPRAAIIAHRGLSNRLQWMTKFFGSASAARVVQTTRPEFDSVVWQLFWPLLNGGTVIVGADGLDGLAGLPALIQEHAVTMVDFVPSALRLLLSDMGHEAATRALASVRSVIVGGEEINADTLRGLRRIAPQARIVNLYGPTEATIGSVAYSIPDEIPTRIPIGRPIDNTQAVVVDERGRLVPVGVAGELLLAGVCVGLGYLGTEADPRGPFIAAPASLGRHGRAYRTGDLARVRPDGDIDFLGRIDSQFKINGFRIDPREIEAALNTHPDVAQSVAILDESAQGDAVAVAFRSHGRAVSHSEIRTYLSRLLPSWMVPQRSLRVPTIPLSPGGKLDRESVRRMFETQARSPDVASIGSTLGSNMHAWVAATWKQELRCEAIGSDANFFDAGGNSQLLVRIQARVRDELRLDVRLVDLLNAPTMGSLAELLELKAQGRLP